MTDLTTDWAAPGTTVLDPKGRLALKMRAGQRLTIVDIKGQQVMDFIAAMVEDPDERLSAMFTRVSSGKWDLKEGYTIYSDRCRPMMRVVHDDNGIHNMTGGYCTQYSNAIRYGVLETWGCLDNLEGDWRELGLDVTKINPDQCISLFMNILHHPDGRMEIVEPTTRPGDKITLEILADLYVGLSNCPEEHNPCNAFHVTEMAVIVE
ncbi:urea carboxylase-associated family protein [Phytohabitans sp. ZYX-F-186]|uniref:Urea carboxylase-associated family protein n=1 Tax=Phytohabitans maris TaxID=3071409 RepID=A0ABU0ZSG7_9ACTN|nr:urea carboxylase-associated family protein [Phytohabitans sp. ZYX-F-186]MDQ7909978.1 urea carboxylase-associated family protein [Phytohabitans sp. ZYX-F-186]